MGNKRDPRKVTVTDVPTLLTNLRTRRSLELRNVGASDVGLHRRATDDSNNPVTFANGFPLPVDEYRSDDKSADLLYGICAAGQSATVWVWEGE